ncbi:MAG: phosphopantetheine-binding protein [Gammaproteobacteria bacterium]|nr:phosphopantetheine-binding protein [Gammaproteobacteria bacterium]
MCIKAGHDELDSVKVLMTMSLNALIAEVFEIDLDDLERTLSLTKDLGMDSAKQRELSNLIDEYFDGLSVDFSENDTLEELFYTVVNSEFEVVSR